MLITFFRPETGTRQGLHMHEPQWSGVRRMTHFDRYEVEVLRLTITKVDYEVVKSSSQYQDTREVSIQANVFLTWPK